MRRLGRSRGGLSTKVHLASDSRSRPLGFITTLGQRHDSIAFELTLAQVAVARIGPGRPRTRPDAVLCDKAYSSRAIREHLSRRKIKAVIAIKDDQHTARLRKGSRGGRPPAFDKVHYRDRNTVERAVNKLRAHRAVATRYDKRDYVYRGTVTSPPSGSGFATRYLTYYGTRPSARVFRRRESMPTGRSAPTRRRHRDRAIGWRGRGHPPRRAARLLRAGRRRPDCVPAHARRRGGVLPDSERVQPYRRPPPPSTSTRSSRPRWPQTA